jgi:hypothetical protein
VVEGLPTYEPSNPVVAARSGVLAPAIMEPRAGWSFGAAVEYGSAIERRIVMPRAFLLDAELLRVRFTAVRGLGPHAFALAQWGVAGGWAGFADSFFDGYHEVIGFVMPERDARPRNTYGAWLRLPAHDITWSVPARPLAVSDARLAVGWRPAPWSQTLLAITLPLASEGLYARGVPTVTVAPSLRLRAGASTLVEGSVALGWAPRHGALRAVQREWNALASLGAQWRPTARFALFGSLITQTASYARTGLPELDKGALVGEVGAALGGPRRRWRVSFEEDIRRDDPGLDLVVKVSTGW